MKYWLAWISTDKGLPNVSRGVAETGGCSLGPMNWVRSVCRGGLASFYVS